ncbi:MAG: hypothetical protein KI793_06955 [Rivularia sp. (in: Bacteria)]|nr:hypothetical protein [Rivularia sp. MS3]
MRIIMKKAAVISIFILISFTNISMKVIAGEINFRKERISSFVATGNSKSAIPLIKLSSGYGVNVSFIPTGETIEKVWLDNPGIASLDVDGCLSGLGKECEEDTGATVLHLRRIKPLDFKQLPSTTTSLLTVVTKGSTKRRVYVFRVAMADVTPKVHTIEITNDNEEFNINRLGNTTDTINLQLINRGFIVAQQQRLISLKSPLIPRVRNFLVSIRAGEQINMAARKNGISLQLVNRLIELGNKSYETIK